MKKKVLLLVVPTLRLGGQERVAVNTAAIMKEVYDTHMAIFDSAGAVYKAPCDLIDLASPAVNGKLAKQANVMKRAVRLGSIKKRLNADFCYSFGNSANYVNLLAGGPGKRIVSFHGYATICMKKSMERLYRNADRILCVSKLMTDALGHNSHTLSGKIECLYNPYDIEDMVKKGDEVVEDYDFSGRVIVTHGRLEEVKNHQRLIKAFSLVKKQFPDARLLIIGEGSERARLEDLVSELGISESVSMIGFRDNPFAYLSKSTLYVLPSYSEGFPNSLIEGMTFLPAVSVDCKSGPREILSDGSYKKECAGIEEADYGMLVKHSAKREFNRNVTEDDRFLAEAICRMLGDSSKYEKYKDKARNRVFQYSFEAYGKRLQSILEESGK